jgi:protein TonB
MAQRAGIEGSVILDLFVDRQGFIRTINILKEDPPNRGFGEAAVKAFQGIRGSPALANDEAVASRYRYRYRFRLR